ncbi:MAG: DHH family phosphoesterase [Clostridia bacterium]|nr:DHH family phosphoesterase [Clostridia bacterium]
MEKTSNSKQNKTKKILSYYPVTIPAIVICVVLCIAMLFYNIYVAVAGFALLIAFFIFAVIKNNSFFNKLENSVLALDRKLSADNQYGELKHFPLPVVLFDSTDCIVWYNTKFSDVLFSDFTYDGVDVKQFTSGQGADIVRERKTIECECNGKKFTAFSGKVQYKNETVYCLYFIEDTELKNYKDSYLSSRPVLMFINLDSVEDVCADFKESQQSEVLGDVEAIVENWFSKYNCIFRKMPNSRFLVFAESSMLEQMKKDKFSVLSQVRSYTYKDRTLGITLSVGIGLGENLSQCETIARKSLDMAMGRGGDQVVVKTADGDFEFFGGVSKGIEKRNKVRSRMIASAIKETIKASDNVLIMGHRFADLDSLGSSVGMAMICEALNKDAKIVMSSKTTLAMPLAKYMIANNMDDLLIEPEDVDEYLSPRTLLIIVDTHRKSFLEYPELFDLVEKVVVIDHHRKTVDHINKAVIFYHEPNASSASEMVTELIQYINIDVSVPTVCAEALMSGITLDTKNFVMKTGVRTFEAAAYLRSLGADTVAVKQLFSNSMKTQKAKSEVVKNAAMYNDSAIGVVDFESDDVRIVASQAADELLNIDGVHGSFVVYKTGNIINISARSYGEINVQLVMEELGGGGHLTMAAAQLENETFDNTLALLKQAIDKVR